jgi:hypothetical protein
MEDSFIKSGNYFLSYELSKRDTECIDFDENFGYYKICESFSIKIYANNNEDFENKGIKVGVIEINIININCGKKIGMSEFDIFNSYNDDIYKLYESIKANKEVYKYFRCEKVIVYIDRMYVYSKYRRNGIASNVLKNIRKIIYYLFNLEIRLITLIAYPVDSSLTAIHNDDKKISNLILELKRLYNSCGFGIIKEVCRPTQEICMYNYTSNPII